MNKRVLGILLLGALLPLTAFAVSAARSRQAELSVETSDAQANQKVDARQHQLATELLRRIQTDRARHAEAQASR